MPATVQGNIGGKRSDFNAAPDFNYDYPEGLDFRPGSDFHQDIRSKLIERAQVSHNEMSKRYSSWNDVDHVLTTYIPTDQTEKDLKDIDRRKPVSIVFPYSYAMMESLLAYLISAFGQDPIFRYEGVSPEDTIGAMLMELTIQLHCNKTKVPLALHTQFRDSLGYGLGVASPGWTKKRGFRSIKREGTLYGSSGGLLSENGYREDVETLLFEGNCLHNISPYHYLPDPNVSASEAQNGEFVGWIRKDNKLSLMREEKYDSDMFNAKYLKYVSTNTSQFAQNNDERTRKTTGGGIPQETVDNNRVYMLTMYVDLIPKEWKLGTSEEPEKWCFNLANDNLIMKAYPVNFNHGMYPVSVAAPDYDGYTSTPISRLEILYGLQGVLDFLFNCYDDETEVLTDKGWKLINDAKTDNCKVATVDPSTREMWFEKPSQWHEYDYSGNMVGFSTKRHDLLVTPNHQMFAKIRYSGGWEFVSAAEIALHGEKEYKIPMSVQWRGDQVEDLHFPSEGARYPEANVDSAALVGFLGWFLSDGSLTKGKKSGSYMASLRQSKSENFKRIDEITKHLGFHVGKYFHEAKQSWQWSITDRRFYGWMKENCYVGEKTTGKFKRIPEIIKDADSFWIEIFLDEFILGDGHIVPSHPNLCQIGTESPYLADDLQELCLKVGWSCHVREDMLKSGNSFWVLNINKNSPESTITGSGTYLKQYDGKVYCFTNSTHLTVVRRNGKSCIAGQSHITNVRKAVNDMIIVDPQLVNINDMKDPQPGKLIRLRRPAWGKGVKDVAMQLGINDITQANIGDSAYIVDWMQKIAATDDPIMGSLRRGGPERLTKGEFQGTQQGGYSRLARIAMIIGLQAMQDIGYQFATNTQQLMDEETYVRATGRWQEQLMGEYGVQPNGRIKVSPFDLLVDYDVFVRDGSVPGSNFSEGWLQMFNILAGSEELMQQFDMTRIFMHIARSMGAKNVEEFKRNASQIQPTVMSDEGVAREVEKGNLTPVAA